MDDDKSRPAAAGPVQGAVGPLVDGRVPAGSSCPFSARCGLKEVACNGDGCPVSDGKTTGVAFSCAVARAFEMFD